MECDLETKAAAKSLRLLAALFGSSRCSGACDDSEDLIFAHNQQLFTVDLDFRTTVLTKQDSIARFDVERLSRSIFLVFACARRDDLAFLRLFFGRIGDDDSPTNLLSLFNAAYDDAVMERCNICRHALEFSFQFPL